MVNYELIENAQAHDIDPARTFSEYMRLLRNNLVWILAGSMAFGGLALLYVLSTPNEFRTTAQVLVEKVDRKPEDGQSSELILPSLAAEEDYFGTQVQVLTSNKILYAAAQSLGLPESTRFTVIGPGTPLTLLGGKVGPDHYLVEAERIKKSRVITLTVKGTDAAMSAKLANAITEIFIRENAMENLFISKQMYKWLEDEEKGVVTEDPARRDELANSLQSVVNDPELIRMRQSKDAILDQLRELSQRYRPAHPKIKELSQALIEINTDIQARRDSLIESLKKSLSGALNITNMRILDPAIEPTSPSNGARVVLVIFGFFAGAAGGASLVIMREILNQKIRTQRDLPQHSQLPLLGLIPKIKVLQKSDAGRNAGMYTYLLNNNLELRDAVVNIRTHILFSVPYEQSRRIMFASSTPSEGRSTVAMLVALSMSDMGRKILLIDADLRRPYLHHYLGLEAGKGLADYLSGDASIEEVVRPVPGNILKVIVGGDATNNSSALLSSPRFDQLMDRLSGEFDRIIINVPPILFIPDGLIVGKSVSCAVLVCASGVTHKDSFTDACNKFAAMRRPLVGFVLNQMDHSHLLSGDGDQEYREYRNKYLQIRPYPGSEKPADPVSDKAVPAVKQN